MQSKTNCKVPVETKFLAKMMEMEEVEVRFFPKKDELKSLLKDYNYSVISKKVLIEKLNEIKAECQEENLDAYANGITALIKAIEYRYC